MESYCFMGTEFQFCKMKRVQEMGGDDGGNRCECTLSLNYTLRKWL